MTFGKFYEVFGEGGSRTKTPRRERALARARRLEAHGWKSLAVERHQSTAGAGGMARSTWSQVDSPSTVRHVAGVVAKSHRQTMVVYHAAALQRVHSSSSVHTSSCSCSCSAYAAYALAFPPAVPTTASTTAATTVGHEGTMRCTNVQAFPAAPTATSADCHPGFHAL